MSIISCLSSIVQLILLLLPVPKSIMMCLFLKTTRQTNKQTSFWDLGLMTILNLYCCTSSINTWKRTLRCKGRTTRTSCWSRALLWCPPGKWLQNSWPVTKLTVTATLASNNKILRTYHDTFYLLNTFACVRFIFIDMYTSFALLLSLPAGSQVGRTFSAMLYRTSSIFMHVGSQSCPKRITRTRSSSDSMAWSTCQPLWRCGSMYDILMLYCRFPSWNTAVSLTHRSPRQAAKPQLLRAITATPGHWCGS